MKQIFFIFITAVCLNTSAQQTKIEEYFVALDNALLQKDTLTLKILLHDNLTLGHSNGWVESKESLLKTLVTDYIVYKSFENTETPEIHFETENLITTRRKINVSGIVNGTDFQVKLNALEAWICENGNWQLLVRQSVNRKE